MAKKKLDIVERLRRGGACADGCDGRCQECPDDRQREAADEIERLRAALLPFSISADRYDQAYRARVQTHADEGAPIPSPLPDSHRISCSIGECRAALAAFQPK